MRAFLKLCAASLALLALAQPARAVPPLEAVDYHLNNAVAFTQLPTDPDYFIGRRFSPVWPHPAMLLRFKMNWTNNDLAPVDGSDLLPAELWVPVNGKQVRLYSYYDPHAVQFNGETWLAFECAGDGLVSVAVCIAPLRADGLVDIERLTLPVQGGDAPPDQFSASVPKLLVFQNRLYLYWTSLQLEYRSSGAINKGGTTRGALLRQEAGGARRMWADGAAGVAIAANDPVRSMEVYGGSPAAPDAGFMADMFDVQTDGTTIYATAAVGGIGCGGPVSEIYGCYRLRISSSQQPLAPGAFGGNFATSVDLPFNPHEYSRIFRAPDGSRFLMAFYHPPVLNGSPVPANTVPSPHLLRFPIDLASLTFQATGPAEITAAAPVAGALRRLMTLQTLQTFNSGCNDLSQTNTDCMSAIGRYCLSQGYRAAGYGPMQYNGNSLALVCMRDLGAARITVDLPELRAINANCGPADPNSDSCKSAITSYCSTRGYAGGGFGPNEAANNQFNLTCVGTQRGVQVHTTYSQLGGQCTSTTRTADTRCLAGAETFCQANGYASSYGILNHSQENVVVGCTR